jgi:hypothetical protein
VVEQDEVPPHEVNNNPHMMPADIMEVTHPAPIELEPFEMVPAQTEDIPTLPSQELYKQEGMEGAEFGHLATDEAIRHIEDRGQPVTEENLQPINVPVAGELEGYTAVEGN